MLDPFPPGTDYFTAMGLPRKLRVDRQDLERRYHDLSRRFHPDFFQRAAPRDRVVSLENSALINKAYRTLRDPLARAEYLVRLEAGPGAELKPEAPHSLFEEILELNELLSDYRLADPDERPTLQPQLEAKSGEFRAEYEALQRHLTEELFPRWDRGVDSGSFPETEKAALLAEMSRIIANRAYLRRVLNNLDEALTTESASVA
jgi:molecular chaperone HscB